MPQYTFLCDEDTGGCNHSFTKSLSFKEYDEWAKNKQLACPSCNKRKHVYIPINTDVTVIDISPVSLGALQERNSDKLSKDEKVHLNRKHTEYLREKDNDIPKELPEGMTRGKHMG